MTEPTRGCCQAGAEAFPDPCLWHPATVVYEQAEPLFTREMVERATCAEGPHITVEEMLSNPAVVARRVQSMIEQAGLADALLPRRPRPNWARRQVRRVERQLDRLANWWLYR